MKSKLVSLIVALVLISGLVALYQWREKSNFIDDVIKQRQEKEIWMSNSLESPFNTKQVIFNGLDFYDPSEKYKVEAEFKKNNSSEQVLLITNEGSERTYEVYGTASFTLDGQLCNLLLLSSEEELGSKLFVPFMDLTSGVTTYGAGRYLETNIPNASTIELDFNQAYNPYCAYMEGYTCPFPPKSNVLPVLIEAGEKVY